MHFCACRFASLLTNGLRQNSSNAVRWVYQITTLTRCITGGLVNIMNVRQGATYPGLTVSIALLVRHAMDDEATLLQVTRVATLILRPCPQLFESELRNRNTFRRETSGSMGFVPDQANSPLTRSRQIVERIRHMLSRNPAVFIKACSNILHHDPDSVTRFTVTISSNTFVAG